MTLPILLERGDYIYLGIFIEGEKRALRRKASFTFGFVCVRVSVKERAHCRLRAVSDDGIDPSAKDLTERWRHCGEHSLPGGAARHSNPTRSSLCAPRSLYVPRCKLNCEIGPHHGWKLTRWLTEWLISEQKGGNVHERWNTVPGSCINSTSIVRTTCAIALKQSSAYSSALRLGVNIGEWRNETLDNIECYACVNFSLETKSVTKVA